MVSLSIAYVVLSWAVRIALAIEITGKRWQAGSVAAWLFVIFLQPWIGLALYVMFGRETLSKSRIDRRAELYKSVDRLVARFNENCPVTRPGLYPEQASLVQLAEQLGNLPILGGNAIDLMIDTNEVVDHIVRDIDAAKHHVHMLFYIFAADATGLKVLKALERASQRGVQCRLLVDGVGSRRMSKMWRSRILQSGIEFGVALPVGVVRSLFARVDLRNHRKVVVIDGEVGYTGSQNIVDADYGHGNLAWYDLMARILGPGVLQLQAVFVSDWYLETGVFLDDATHFPMQPVSGDVQLQVLPSGPTYPVENYQRMVVHALHVAQRNVTITSPYFIPDDAFLQAMQTATLRGVDVVLILPEHSDQFIVGNASRAYYDQLLEMGVRLCLFTNGLLHSKTMAVDEDLAFLGSSNFDIRSFALNYEINLVLYGPTSNSVLRKEHQKYLDDSYQLTVDQWDSRPRYCRRIENLTRLFSPIL